MITLESSTNTHITKSKNIHILKQLENMSTIVLKTEGNMIVEHGHHNTVATEKDTSCVIKITQQESNPVLEGFQNAFD